jgi:parallel beta-helix repeat protein
VHRAGCLLCLLALLGCGRAHPPLQEAPLPLPAPIADGSTVKLQCGKTYRGTLDLRSRSKVTVTTAGTCGKASISPGAPVTGWTRYRGRIHVAALGYAPVQVAISGAPLSRAHWPNRGWARPGSAPPGELAGATLAWLENQSVVRSEILTGNKVSVAKPYYVEGKLWMLDSAGEWAYADGRLYVWSADGRSPEGRAWASPDADGIDADKSDGVTVDNVRIFAATDGISADGASGLSVLRTDIANSARDGIWANDSRMLRVDGVSVSNARRNGIDGWYWITGATVSNTSVERTGMGGQPSPSDAGIFFGDGAGNRIENVRVRDSAYHGISVLHNRATRVLDSLVENACARLTDCAGIYTGARDRKPLDLYIEGNTVINVKGSEGIGIYLDDFANGVTVRRNTLRNNTRGMVLHNAFDNLIDGNEFASNADAHLAFGQDSGTIRNNRVTGNLFTSTAGEWTYKLEAGSNLKTFASFDANTYAGNNAKLFARTWDGRSDGITHDYLAWKAWSGQDAGSRMVEGQAYSATRSRASGTTP